MHERTHLHNRETISSSGVLPEFEVKPRRNFIDPIILETVSQSSLADAAVVLSYGISAGLGAVGIGVGTYFYQRGRAAEISAGKGNTLETQRANASRTKSIPEEK